MGRRKSNGATVRTYSYRHLDIHTPKAVAYHEQSHYCRFMIGHSLGGRCGMVWYGVVWYGMVWYGVVWYGMVWYGMAWYGMVWHGMVWSERDKVQVQVLIPK